MVLGLRQHHAVTLTPRAFARPPEGVLVLAVVLAAASVAAAGDVSGKFRVGEREIAPKHAAAYPVRDPRDPRKIAIEVVLAEGAIDAAAAAAALDPHTQLINQEGLGNYVLFWVRPDGEVSMNATFAKTMTQYLDGTRGLLKGLVAELAENGAKRVAGRVRTREPVKTRSGETYALDVTFATAVTRPPAGKALGDGGGEPGRALEALHGAVAKKNWPRIRAALGAATRARLEADYRTPEENLAYAVDILEMWLPKNDLRVGRAELRDGSAILEVEGERFPGTRALYLVRMVREGEAWRFGEGTFLGLLTDQPKKTAERAKSQ